MNVVIPARLDGKTGLRVMCGSIGNVCDADLARVRIIPRSVTWGEKGHVLAAGDRVLCMLDGWVLQPAKGAGELMRLTLSNHARQGSKQGRKPRHRRPIISAEAFDVLHLYSDGEVIRDILFPPAEGIVAECPLCRRVNTLRPSRLQVVAR